MKNSLDTPVRYLKGIGPKRAKTFANLGVVTIEDLLYYFPRRYEDRTRFLPIAELKGGATYTVKAQVLARGSRQSFRRRRFNIIEIAVGDDTGKIFCVWFNQPYLADYFKVGQQLIFYGKVERYLGRLQMSSPEFEIIEEEGQSHAGTAPPLNIGRIVPIYTVTQGISQRYLRRTVKAALDEYLVYVNDFLAFDIRSRNSLLNLAKGLLNIHFPESSETQKQAFSRLCFDEFFVFQVPLALRKLKKKEKPGISHRTEGSLVSEFLANLTFKLTDAQERVLREIKLDMAKPQAMQRLLQGDVGSGKTAVATIASLFAIQGGYQVAFMVPTEILAKQHYEKIKRQVSSVKYQGKEVKISVLTSSLNKAQKEKTYQQIKEGKIDLIIGTHALLEEKVEFKNLGLVVIDEQHKFGVGQRALLPKKGKNPDVLIMTATPIPRTLAITIYADLDISVIDELPPGRVTVGTLNFNSSQHNEAYTIVKEEVAKGNQAYIIYPVIEESYAFDIAGAKKMYEELKRNEFKDYRLGLIHGRLKQHEQDEVMAKFKEKHLDLLVATTVLEVGIDIPSATCMVIEHAERFGLSQLHQLRGRIGRGVFKSYCILVSNAATPESSKRLEALVKYSDGFRIAEEDLRIRGPGEFFGSRQHGLSELKLANPLTQMRLLKRAREEAISLVNSDPQLQLRQNIALKAKLLNRFPEYEKLMVVG